MNFLPVLQGFFLGATMIIPIGAQNAFILNQGIKKQYHLTAASICMLSDILLISLGIFGSSQLLTSGELAFTILTWLGIAFLSGYGLLSFKSALFSSQNKTQALNSSKTLSKVVLTCLLVTLLNPHAYIDTVVILGGVGGQFIGEAKYYFAIGCMLASIVWFYGLAMLAARMSHILSRQKVKRGIDLAVGSVMWIIAGLLYFSWA